jgi:hypothetical protein
LTFVTEKSCRAGIASKHTFTPAAPEQTFDPRETVHSMSEPAMSKIVNFAILAGAVLPEHLVLPATASAATLRASASDTLVRLRSTTES